MELQVLENLAYSFYPRGICASENRAEYLNSLEFKRLKETVGKNQGSEYLKEFASEMEKRNGTRIFRDATRTSLLERSTNLQLLWKKDNTWYSISVLISFIIPYYLCLGTKVQVKENSDQWVSLPELMNKEEEKLYSEDIRVISNLIEEKLGYNRFPEVGVNQKVKNISFQDLALDQMTMYNAFFLDGIFI